MNQNTSQATSQNTDPVTSRNTLRFSIIRRVPTVRSARRGIRAPFPPAAPAAPRPKSLGARRAAARGNDFPMSFAALPFGELTAIWRNGRLCGIHFAAPEFDTGADPATACPTSGASV